MAPVDRKHELAILDRQMEMQRQGHTQRLEEIAVTADIAEAQALCRHDAQPSGWNGAMGCAPRCGR
jgi:hypothetical protein